ncbi:MAG TPA: hypothetical protein VGQ87_03560 [Patescibacteria group bacterium]|jgi:DNA-binding GntR family transcriptional regulator|nr:hypothetical protein [Patescibacteria group bacterium]
MFPTIKQPSAWIPIALSLTVLTAFLISISISGAPVREPDEGTAAHLFQIWLALEVFMAALFAIKWLPQNPKQALIILAVQIAAVLVACYPVYYFKL